MHHHLFHVSVQHLLCERYLSMAWEDYYGSSRYQLINSSTTSFTSNKNYYAKFVKYNKFNTHAIYYVKYNNSNVNFLIESCSFSETIHSNEGRSTAIFILNNPGNVAVAKTSASKCYYTGSESNFSYNTLSGNFLTIQYGSTVRFIDSTVDACGENYKGFSPFKFQYLNSITKRINVSCCSCLGAAIFAVNPNENNSDYAINCCFVNNSVSEGDIYWQSGVVIIAKYIYSIKRCIFTLNKIDALTMSFQNSSLNIIQSAFINNQASFLHIALDHYKGIIPCIVLNCYFENSTNDFNAEVAANDGKNITCLFTELKKEILTPVIMPQHTDYPNYIRSRSIYFRQIIY